ncbi:MAG: sulfite exporter TauE/SafE family protein [Armatimonadetes bacterium]|nr:sulfite exporter TauE/SafE family protein [Armatimonadota bacterium]MDW8153842.1 sulfite exporter TauE/SafE family protein [Armatimonadota bacterium]
MLPLVVLLAFGAGLLDAVLGMGYGTILAPLLLLSGYRVPELVPALLLSQCAAGLVGARFHHVNGNASFQRGSVHLRAALVLMAAGFAGGLLGPWVARRVSEAAIRIYMGVMIFGLGCWLVAGRRAPRFSWGRLMTLGIVASVNKALTGGGYGPLLAGGQMMAGLNPRAAVAITNLSEAVVSLAALGGYAWWFAASWRWDLVLAVTCGAALAAPLGARAVRRVGAEALRTAVGIATALLGLLALLSVRGA